MKILYADTDHASQVNFINALKGQNDWSAKYAMATPAIDNALSNEEFDLVVCGVEFIPDVLNSIKGKSEIVAIGHLDKNIEIEDLLSKGVNHFMKHPFCPINFQKIASNISTDTTLSQNDTLPDFEYLDRITKGRIALKLDLMEIFITVVTEELENISLAIPAKDLNSIGKSAHRMKSNVRMMGLRTMMQLLDSIEDQSKGDPQIEFFDVLADTSEMLKCSVNLVKTEIQKYNSIEAN